MVLAGMAALRSNPDGDRADVLVAPMICTPAPR